VLDLEVVFYRNENYPKLKNYFKLLKLHNIFWTGLKERRAMRGMARRIKEVEFGMEHKCYWVIFFIKYYNVACQELF
jgi:hypothetical protein